MRKFLRSAVLGIVALALAIVPALAQEQAGAPDVTKFIGVYEFEAPDYGLISLVVEKADDGTLTLTAMQATLPLAHLSGNLYELNSPDFGVIKIGFIEEEDGTVSAMTIDSYDFSFVAVKKTQ